MKIDIKSLLNEIKQTSLRQKANINSDDIDRCMKDISYHSFEPRYDTFSDSEESSKIYLYDICIKCGKIINRKV